MFSDEKDKLFCAVAINLNILTQEQVDEALQQQTVDRAIGVTKPIGAYFFEAGLISKEQIAQILEAQQKCEPANAQIIGKTDQITSTSDSDIELSQGSLVWLIFLAALTGGLYVPIWYLMQSNGLNKLRSNNKISPAPAYFSIIAIIIWSAIKTMETGFTQTALDSSTVFEVFTAIAIITNFISFFCMIHLAFHTRRILLDHFQQNVDFKISWLFTLFPNVLYLQHKINKLNIDSKLNETRGYCGYGKPFALLFGLMILTNYIVIQLPIGINSQMPQSQEAAQNNDSTISAPLQTPASPADISNETYKLAEKGDVDAQWKLGKDLFTGSGVEKDTTEAAKWLIKAADQGHEKAQYLLGTLYYQGIGVPQDAVEALKWFIFASEQGGSEAQIHLGAMYNNGNSVPQDYVQAYKWLTIGAKNNPSAMVDQWRASAEKMLNAKQLEQSRALIQSWQKKSWPELQVSVTSLDPIKKFIIAHFNAYIRSDAETLASLVHPAIVKDCGGVENLIQQLQQMHEQSKASGWQFPESSLEFRSNPLFQGKFSIQQFLISTPIQGPSNRFTAKVSFLAVSEDFGSTFYFTMGQWVEKLNSIPQGLLDKCDIQPILVISNGVTYIEKNGQWVPVDAPTSDLTNVTTHVEETYESEVEDVYGEEPSTAEEILADNPSKNEPADAYRNINFEELTVDLQSLLGTKVKIEGFGHYVGGAMTILLSQRPYSRGLSINVEISNIPRDQKLFVIKEESRETKITVFGTVAAGYVQAEKIEW